MLKKPFGQPRTLAAIHFNQFDPNPATADYAPFANNASWALPQLMAFLGSKIPLKKGENGLISFSLTLEAIKDAVNHQALELTPGNPLTKDEMLGILSVCRAIPRGKILGAIKQSSEQGLRYSAGVPLFCSAFKEFRDVKYADWDWEDEAAKYFLDGDMLTCSAYFNTDFSEAFSRETLLKYRENALLIKSGKKAGDFRVPELTASVYGVSDKDFTSLPRLLKLALTQLWIYSPVFQSKYIISNFTHLDSPAIPLVSTEIVKFTSSDIPW